MKKSVGYPLPLGVSMRDDIVNFSIAVKRGKTCTLCLFKRGAAVPKEEVVLQERDAVGEVRFLALPKASVIGMEYCYRIEEKDVLDPYVKIISDGKYGLRGVISEEAYDWEDDKPLCIPYHEVIAYNLHVRGFTKHTSAKGKKKGTFAGVIEKIPYLQELGINQIQCMPVYYFVENEKYTNYWGYGDSYSFAIQNKYASGKNAATELKDMVKSCHKAGIEVVLHLPFTNKVSQQMILDVLRMFVMEYHVDGFLLNSYNVSFELLKGDPILKETKLLEQKDDFQNTMRRFLKGDEGLVPEVMSWLSKRAVETGSCNYITNHTGFTMADLVSYNEKHNEANGENNTDGPKENYSWNCGEEGATKKKHILALRKRQMKNAMFLVMMAQGTPSILMGDEFCNSQGGNNNVYCQDNDTAWLDWKNLDRETEFFEYTKELIRLRKTYPILHTANPLSGKDMAGQGVPDISYHGESAWRPDTKPESRQLGIYYHAEDGTDIYLAYNMHYEMKKLALPTLADGKKWSIVISTAAQVEEGELKNQREMLVPERTIIMFEGR